MFAVFGATAFIASEYNTFCMCWKLSEDFTNKPFGTPLHGIYFNTPSFDFNMFVLNFSKREVLSWLVVPLFLGGQRYSHTEISENTILNG